MKYHFRNTVLLTLMSILILSLSGCHKELRYSVDQFSNDLKSRGYVFEVQDFQKDFLPSERKKLAFDNEDILIFVNVYKSNQAMEIDAQNISIDGCSYKTEKSGINVSWVAPPHFFKKGNIIVQYIGEDDILVSDLSDILGDEFAGYGKIQTLESSTAG